MTSVYDSTESQWGTTLAITAAETETFSPYLTPLFKCSLAVPISPSKTLTGHGRSVRSLSFSPSSSSLLCSGSVSGEVRLWSVPASTCVGCYQAHHGTTEVLSFLLGGAVLLSAGSDHMVGER